MKMKRIISLFFICTICLLFTACGASSSDSHDEAVTKSKEVVTLLSEMNDASDYASSIVITIWQEFGPDDTATILYYMTNISSEDDFRKIYKDKKYDIQNAAEALGCFSGSGAMDDEEKANFINVCIAYINSLDIINTNTTTAKSELGEIKNLDEDIYNTLKDYYLISTEYGSAAAEPTGSQVSYSSSISDYKSQVKSAKNSVELELD